MNDNDVKLIMKKQDKILNLLTKIAKTLNLIPSSVKEKELINKEIEKNARANEEYFKQVENLKPDQIYKTYLDRDFNFDNNDLYSDVIGNDLLGGGS